MSVEAQRWAWRHAAPAIDSSGAMFVLVVLADHAGDHDGEDWTCFPSVAKIARNTRLSERAVERHLIWLIADGWISRAPRGVRKADKGKFTYTLHPTRSRRSPAKLAGETGGASPDNLAGENGPPSPAKTSGQTGELHPPKKRPSPAKSSEPPTPPYNAEPPCEPPLSTRESEDFERVFEAFAAADPHTVARTLDAPAWAKACLLVEPARLLAAALRYLADCRAQEKRPFSLARWLQLQKWEPWLGEPPSLGVAEAPSSRTPFEGPAELMAALAPQRNWPVFLAGCRWDEEARQLICATAYQKREVEIWAGGVRELAGQLRIEVIVERERVE